MVRESCLRERISQLKYRVTCLSSVDHNLYAQFQVTITMLKELTLLEVSRRPENSKEGKSFFFILSFLTAWSDFDVLRGREIEVCLSKERIFHWQGFHKSIHKQFLNFKLTIMKFR